MSTTALSDIPCQRLDSEDDFSRRRSNRSDGASRAKDIAIVVVVVVAVGALILALVALAKPGHLEVEYEQEFNGPGFQGSEDKIWTFAIGHYDVNLEYLDEATGTIKGYNVDIINAVCKIANKNCQLVYDSSERCWTNQAGNRARGGEGLLGGWYDACTGWGITYDRSRTFSFTKPYSKLSGVGIYVANGTTNFDWTNLRGRTIGFVDGFSSDEHCLARYADDLIQHIGRDTSSASARRCKCHSACHISAVEAMSGDPSSRPCRQALKGSKLSVSSNQIVYLPSLDDLVAAVINGNVDAAFCYSEPAMSQLKRVTTDSFPNRCALGGYGMMTRKNNPTFLNWWNDAFDKLVNTAEYRMICRDLKDAHGQVPGRNPDEVCL